MLYNNAVETVINHLPDATVYISGITHIKGSTAEIQKSNKLIIQVNESMKMYAEQREDVHFISTAGLFNFPSQNALNRFQTNDLSGVHLTAAGKSDVVHHILEGLKQQELKTPTKKRVRSNNETPPSLEKPGKAGKVDKCLS